MNDKFVGIKMDSGSIAVVEKDNQSNLIAICPNSDHALRILRLYNVAYQFDEIYEDESNE